jgi:hypothetical protein
MRLAIGFIGAVLLMSTATVGNAEVNCKQVMKYLQTGRSVDEVATTMVISESDVKKCQEQAPAAGDAKAGEKKDAPAAGH